MTKDYSLSPAMLLGTLLDADRVLNLSLSLPDEAARALAARYMQEEVSEENLPENIRGFMREREEAREAKDWPRADELRDLIESAGYTLEDKAGGTRVVRK